MSLISLLDDSCGSIRQSLSLQEIQIAFTFLKKRFPEYSLKQIVSSLNQYIFQKEYSTFDNSKKIFQRNQKHKNFSKQSKLYNFQCLDQKFEITNKKQHFKLIAKLYCQNGLKYTLVQYFFPDLTLKEYKHILETIMIQTLNNIEKFLKYQCNVLLDQISKKLKKKLAPKLINIHSCIGKQNSQIVQTYFKFIERFYIDQAIQIQYKEALSLFKQIQIFSKTLEQQNINFQISKQKQSLLTSDNTDCSSQQEKAIIILYKKHQNITKVSDLMCQTYGYNLKWSKHSLKHIIRHMLKCSLQRLIQSANKYDKKVDMYFSSSQQNLNLLCQNENCFQIKQKLLDFYLQKSVTLHRIRQLVKSANLFFVGQYSPKQFSFADQNSQHIQLPQLKTDLQSQKLESFMKKEKKEHLVIDLQQNILPTKKRIKNKNWIQVMQIDSDSHSNNSKLYHKEIETDIQSNVVVFQQKKVTKSQNQSEKIIINDKIDNNNENQSDSIGQQKSCHQEQKEKNMSLKE